MNILVSIVVPIYNAENYLTKCIYSIIKQTYKNIEIILVNDGSTDNSLKICETFALNDKRIIIISQKNMGVSTARNIGINVAKGEYISFVDSDDTIEDNYIQELVDNSNSGKVDVVICGYNDIYTNNKKIENKLSDDIKLNGKISDDYAILKKYLKYRYLKIYKMNLLKENNINFPIHFTDAEDQVFNFKIFSLAKNYNFVNESLYNYCHVNSESLSKQATIKSFFSNLEKLKKEKIFLDTKNIKEKELCLTNSAFDIIWKYAVIKDINDNYFKFRCRILKAKELLYGSNFFNNKRQKFILKLLEQNIIFPIYLWYILSYMKRKMFVE